MIQTRTPVNVNLQSECVQTWPGALERLMRCLCVLQLWMETEESDMRSCPLCQLIFPVGYPDDALIKHIDSHLENSKI